MGLKGAFGWSARAIFNVACELCILPLCGQELLYDRFTHEAGDLLKMQGVTYRGGCRGGCRA